MKVGINLQIVFALATEQFPASHIFSHEDNLLILGKGCRSDCVLGASHYIRSLFNVWYAKTFDY